MWPTRSRNWSGCRGVEDEFFDGDDDEEGGEVAGDTRCE
jgi:hypothetical protein